MRPEDAADDTVVALPDAKGSGGASPPLRNGSILRVVALGLLGGLPRRGRRARFGPAGES